jgi:hypothetical protein
MMHYLRTFSFEGIPRSYGAFNNITKVIELFWLFWFSQCSHEAKKISFSSWKQNLTWERDRSRLPSDDEQVFGRPC